MATGKCMPIYDVKRNDRETFAFKVDGNKVTGETISVRVRFWSGETGIVISRATMDDWVMRVGERR
jgi:hypothetical protein